MKKLWLFFLGVILFFVSLFFDKSVALLFVYLRNPFFDYIALIFSYTFVHLGIFFVLIFVVLWIKNKNSAFVFVLSFVLVVIVTYALKLLVLRPRPFLILSIPLIAYFSYEFAWFNTSLPSSHASTAFCSFAAVEKLSKLKLVWLSLAVISVLSRLYSGVHYLSDVVAGALLGYFLTVFVFWLDKRFKFSRIWK